MLHGRSATRDPHRGPTQGTHTEGTHTGDPHNGPAQGTHTGDPHRGESGFGSCIGGGGALGYLDVWGVTRRVDADPTAVSRANPIYIHTYILLVY